MNAVRERLARLSLKSRMAAAVTLCITAALILAGWAYGRHMSDAVKASVEAQQAAIADGLAAEVGDKIGALRQQIELVALGTAPGLLADRDAMRARLRALTEYHPLIDDSWAFSADGRIGADYPPVAGRAGSSVAGQAYFRSVTDSKSFVITEPSVDAPGGYPQVLLIAPVYGGRGEVAGALGGTVRLQSPRLLGRLARQRVGESGYVGAFTRDGVILAHPRSERVMQRLQTGGNPATDLARAGFSGSLQAVNRAGVPMLYTYRPVAGTDWIVYTAYPVAEAYGALGRDLRILALLVALLSIIGGFVAWSMMSRLLAPLSALEREMGRITREPHAATRIAVRRDDEIGRLTQAFNRMLTARIEADRERAAAHEQIQNTGRMFGALYERSPIGMALLRRDGTFVRSNPAFQRLTGYSDDELACMTEASLSVPEALADDRRAAEELARRGAVAPYEKEYLSQGGLKVPVRVSAVAVQDAGVNECVWLIAEDVTVRRQMMDALKQSEAEARMLSAVASHSASAVVIAGRDGRIEWVNPAYERMTGHARDALVGHVPGSLLQGRDTDPATVATMAGALAAQEPFAVEVLNYARDGRPYWASIECAPVFDHLGSLERFVAIVRDVTESRDAARALTESEDKYRRVYESAREVIWQFDREGRVSMLNPAWERLTGFAVADCIGRPFYEFLVPEQRETARAALEDMLAGRRSLFDELGSFMTASGEARWLEIRAQTFLAEDGAPTCMGTLHDVHERRSAEAARRTAEEALRASQERYQRAIESASDVVWERDLRSGRFYISERVREVLRLKPEDATGALEDLFMRVHPDDIEFHRRQVQSMPGIDGMLSWEARYRTGDGGYRWLRVRGRTVRDAAGRPILTSGTASDVHEARVAGEALRAMQVRYQRALDGSNDGVWERDIAADSFYLSDRFDEILGHPPGGQPRLRSEWLDQILADDRPVHDAAVEEMLSGSGAAQWEVRFRTAQGAYRWLRLRGIGVRGADGRVILTSGTASDVHAAKLAEEELKRHRDNLAQLVEERTVGLEAARRDAERLRVHAENAREAAEIARETAVEASLAKSEFLANMSHELRTPMHAIISFANFGVEKIDRVDTPKLLHYFRNIQKSGSRLLNLLNDLLDLSKLEAGKMVLQFQHTDLGLLADEAITEQEALARSREVTLQSRIEPGMYARLDTLRMLQVLRNLLSNAIKFTPAGGCVTVECAPVAAAGESGPGALLELRVRDDGIGIPEDELEAVFDKFVQSSKTKTGAGGTGLGLAICREIVNAHGGSIHAVNNPPPAAGAVLVVRLPVATLVRTAPPPLLAH